MNRAYALGALAIWAAWGVSWLAAGLWTARGLSVAAPSSYRGQLATALAGCGLLFFGRPASPHALWIVPPALGWAMVALVGVSCAFAWWARVHLGNLWSAGITRRDGHRVVETGPYAIVRHPIYTGIIAGAIGLGVAKATPAALLGVLLIAIGFGLKARIEERFLARELGAQHYAEYRQRVPMLVPRLPPSA